MGSRQTMTKRAQHHAAAMQPMAERDFTRQIRELAQIFGWRRYHTWLAAHSTAGYPDECLVKPPRLVFAELKSDAGKATPAQQEWLDDLAQCTTIETFVWRPSMIDQIAQLLAEPARIEGGAGAWVPDTNNEWKDGD
jgi:hypothetical protein